ncbi:MAG: chloramphenicol acetyltransferase [Chloroflexi bacterium]|nr:chloramphenicol acetyltransferase [Chloroflexota bacterium]
MRTINLEGWPRKEHYLFFSGFDYPYFSLCADMDITTFLPLIRENNISFTAAVMYLVARAANGIPEFRQRVREGNPVEHEVVHPSAAILSKNNLFTFCTVIYEPGFKEFTQKAAEEIRRIKTEPTLEEKIQDDSMLFMTSIPWVSFTSLTHPVKLSPADSVPRFAWGKFREEEGKIMMPLSVQGHHAVMDGLHAGLFYEEFKRLLDHPLTLLLKS